MRAKFVMGRLRKFAVLPMVALALFGSVAARLASGTGSAIAREVQAIGPHDNSGQGAQQGRQRGQGDANCAPDPEIGPILERLAARENNVTAAETRLAEKEKTLSAAESRVTKRLSELKAAEERLSATLAKTGTAAENDLTQLTAVYETMKPKDAVPLFEAMDPQFAAGFLGRMRPDAAAAVMSKMNPDLVYAISAILAGRNARVPKN